LKDEEASILPIAARGTEKGEWARKLGAMEVTNYVAALDWVPEVVKLTDGIGVDQ
jgi:NADPH:quinone reductase-like Zn-dependent oxidoreductase